MPTYSLGCIAPRIGHTDAATLRSDRVGELAERHAGDRNRAYYVTGCGGRGRSGHLVGIGGHRCRGYQHHGQGAHEGRALQPSGAGHALLWHVDTPLTRGVVEVLRGLVEAVT